MEGLGVERPYGMPLVPTPSSSLSAVVCDPVPLALPPTSSTSSFSSAIECSSAVSLSARPSSRSGEAPSQRRVSLPPSTPSPGLGLRVGSLLQRYRAAARISYFTHCRPSERHHGDEEEYGKGKDEDEAQERSRHLMGHDQQQRQRQSQPPQEPEQKEQLTLSAAVANPMLRHCPLNGDSHQRQQRSSAAAAPPPPPSPPPLPPPPPLPTQPPSMASAPASEKERRRCSSSMLRLRVPPTLSAAQAVPGHRVEQASESNTRRLIRVRASEAREASKVTQPGRAGARLVRPSSLPAQAPSPSSSSPSPPLPPPPPPPPRLSSAAPLSRRRASAEAAAAAARVREEREASWTAAFVAEYQRRVEERRTQPCAPTAHPTQHAHSARTALTTAGCIPQRSSATLPAAPPAPPPPPSSVPALWTAVAVSSPAFAATPSAGPSTARAASASPTPTACSAVMAAAPRTGADSPRLHATAAVWDGLRDGAASGVTASHSPSSTPSPSPSSTRARRGSGRRVRWIDWAVE